MKPMSVVVRSVFCVFGWFVLVFGAYVIVHGHLTPGGGFQGGAVFATFFAALMASLGEGAFGESVSSRFLSTVESLGLLLFWLLGLLGMGRTFFHNFLAGSGSILFGGSVPVGPNEGALATGGTVALMNLSVGMEVVAGLTLITVYMALARLVVPDGGERGHDR